MYALAAGNGMLFSGAQDKTIRVHTFNQIDNSFAFSAALTAHTKSVHVLVVSGDLLFSGGGEGNIIMWSLQSGQALQVKCVFLQTDMRWVSAMCVMCLNLADFACFDIA